MTTLVPISPFAHEAAGFNHAAATEVYQTIMKMDDASAEVYSDLLVGAAFLYDQERYAGAIDKALGEAIATRGPAIREGLLRSFVAKRATGADVSTVVAAAEVVSKAYERFDFSPEDRRRNALDQHRDLANGRFVKEHRTIQHVYDRHGRGLPAQDDRMAEKFGIPKPRVRLSAEQRSHYQQGYRQVQGLVSNFEHARDRAFLHLHYNGEPEKIIPLPGPDDLRINPEKALHSAAISVLPVGSDTEHTSSYEMLNAISGQYGGDDPSNGLARIAAFNAERTSGDPFLAGSGLFARLGASSHLLDQTFRNDNGDSVLPAKLQLAVKTGHLVGTYGPEAQKIVQPTADKTAYRYRGTERATPDRRLSNAVESIRRDPRLRAEDKREIMVHGTETGNPANPWQPSSVLHYFHGLLPDANLNTLQLRSGTVPPSQGVIVDKTGKIASQAVGYGDDHYLPFNLKHLKALKGGEYLRTRTWGGPSTEDVYTGLISGAKSITVVSHNGVYTMEFDPSFVGSRRYNDKAARMVARYAHLLDAVQSGQVTTGGLDPTRIAEIHADAEASFDPVTEHADYTQDVARRMAAEQRNPQFSAQQKAEAGQRFLDAEALKHKTPDGHEMTRTEFVDDWIEGQARQQYRAYRDLEQDPGESSFVGDHSKIAPNMTIGDFKRQVAERNGLNDADPARFSTAAVTAMGLGEHYNRYVEREEQTYKASLRPLALNGAGYQLALNALKEQFPYYINRVDFHPWHDAKPGEDTGYVKPKHNRPAEALAGFFDRTINGQAKVHADSIRGQGSAKTLRPYLNPTEKVEDIRRKRAEAGGAPGTPGTPGGGRDLPPAIAAQLRNDADLALLKTIKNQTRYASKIDAKGDKAKFNGASGQLITEVEDSDLRRVAPTVADLLAASVSDLQTQQGTPAGAAALHGRLEAALKEIDEHHLFDLASPAEQATVTEFRSGGRPAAPVKFDRDNITAALQAVKANTDVDFGTRYAPGEHTPDAVKTTYTGDTKITSRGELGLPATVDDDDFDTKIADATARLVDRWSKIVAQQKLNYGTKPAGWQTLPADVEAVARAAQLRRRLADATTREQEAKSADPVQAKDTSIHVYVNGDGTSATGFQPPAKNADAHLVRRDDLDMESFEQDYRRVT